MSKGSPKAEVLSSKYLSRLQMLIKQQKVSVFALVLLPFKWNENSPVGVIKTSRYYVQIITAAKRWWSK